MNEKILEKSRQASFDFGGASIPTSSFKPVATAMEQPPATQNIITVDTTDKESIQAFLKRVAKGRFGDLAVSFDDNDAQPLRSCLVNLNNPEVVQNFITAIDDERVEYKGETITFASPLVFITHRTAQPSMQKEKSATHFKAFTVAVQGEEKISIGSLLLNSPTHSSLDDNNLSSVVLVRDIQLSKEIPKLPCDNVYYYLGLTALHAQRETVLAQTRNTPRRSSEEFLRVPPYQPRLA